MQDWHLFTFNEDIHRAYCIINNLKTNDVYFTFRFNNNYSKPFKVIALYLSQTLKLSYLVIHVMIN